MLKQWPADETKTVAMEELLAGVEKVLRVGYILKRRNVPLLYDGYNLGTRSLVACLDADDAFSKDGLAHHKRQGRDLLTVALGVAFNLGFEQGIRAANRELVPLRLIADAYESLAKKKGGG
jgi:hypothetical protein